MLARLAFALATLSRVASSEPASTPPPAATPTSVDTIVVDTTLPEAFRSELALRLGKREVVWAHAGMEPPGGSSIWVVVGAPPTGAVQLQFVVSDGRAYSRTVDTAGDEPSRAVASAIANTVAAIEAGSVEPEATGVPQPEPRAAEPKTAEPAEPKTVAPTPSPSKAIPIPPSEPPPVGWIGVGIGGAVAFGIGPPSDLQGFVGGGGLGVVRFVHRSGATAAVQVRGLVLPRDGVLLSRVRVSATGGWIWRPNRFELGIEAGVTVEPVWLGSTFDLEPPMGSTRDPAPLIGGRLVVSPGVIAWQRRDRAALRLGLDLDLAESVEARSPTGAVQILRRNGDGLDPFMRAGGFELGLALTAELRFAIRAYR